MLTDRRHGVVRSRANARARIVLVAVGWTLAGWLLGLVVGLATPAHTQIAGTDATVRLHVGRSYDELDFAGVLTGKRTTGRGALGEPVGVGVQLDLDVSTFIGSDGSFNTDVLPAYIQAYSDPHQLTHDLEWALIRHLLWAASAGAALGLVGCLARWRYRSRRARRDRVLTADQRSLVRAYWGPERHFAGRAILVGALLALLAAIPASGWHPPQRARITGNPILADTPLQGTQVGGLLRPALTAAESYIRTYYADTVTFYDQVRDELEQRLDQRALTLPTGPDIAHLAFVTDRHCNIGMDRVIVALAKHLGITTLISGGDDAFSGSFDFEAACTENLAASSQQAGITDVFVGGNHDSPRTLADESDQGIKVLDGEPVTVDGLTFVGLPDPRTSRYGQGIVPASTLEQTALVDEQGRAAAKIACEQDGPVIAVLHDPTAGRRALQLGCSQVVLALDGHVHVQRGPTRADLQDGSTGYQFVGATTGGAPSDASIEQDFASRLTVGPLHNAATIDIVSVDRPSGRLIAVNECTITPQQQITFTQQVVGS